MAQQKKVYVCSECGSVTGKWSGRCFSCNSWETITERQPQTVASTALASGKKVPLINLDKLPSSDAPKRLTSDIHEWDRVIGGGLVPGAFIILTGDPGIGKSTLLLQIAQGLASGTHKVIYFSSEESLAQIKQRAERIGVNSSSVLFSDAARLDAILATALDEQPDVLILDSIQNCYLSDDERALPGTISQLKEAGFRLMKLAKENNITVIITGHITKDGHMAGPKVLEHIVDGVFYLQGEDRWQLRMLRSVKNRFGTINELGFFEMKQGGLTSLVNINQHLLSQSTHAPGASLTCTLEGSRPLLLELQALCVQTKYAMPQRVVTGADSKRVLLIAAILEKYLHTSFSSFDIFFKVSGGCSIKESATDLSIALALLSSFFQQPLPEKSIALGEISLTGQIKPVNHIDVRLKEAEKFGLTNIFLSEEQKIASKNTKSFKNVYELLSLFPSSV